MGETRNGRGRHGGGAVVGGDDLKTREAVGVIWFGGVAVLCFGGVVLILLRLSGVCVSCFRVELCYRVFIVYVLWRFWDEK